MNIIDQLPFINSHFLELLIRGSLNLLVSLFVIRYIYYPVTRRKDYFFAYVLLSNVVFFLVYLLADAQIEIGFAFGMFAIFGIIRYRTNPIPIKEMTYLFVVIGIAVINAISNDRLNSAEVLLANMTIVVVTYVLERVWLARQEVSKMITFEKIELIKPDKSEALLSDLKERTGLNIHRYEIGDIDFLRDVVKIRIFFSAKEYSSHILNEDNTN